MVTTFRGSIGLLGVFVVGLASAQPLGLEERVPNTALVITEPPANTPEPHVLTLVYPAVHLPGARRVLSVPGSGELLLVAPNGLISFERENYSASLAESWFELPSDTTLLDAAFPTDWDASKPLVLTVFVGAGETGTLQVVPYRRGDSAPGAPALSLPDVPRDAAGGTLAVDAAGSLLLALGDLGTPELVGQAGELAGSVQRLDPDTLAPEGRVATGLRLARMAVDPIMGSLFATDYVPEGPWEVNRVAQGLNFGWPRMAGTACYPVGSTCSSIGLTRPLVTSGLVGAGPFVGGEFSYDEHAPDLHGQFLLANSATGEIGAIRDTGGSSLTMTPLTTVSGAISGMGVDEDGIVYFIVDGRLHALRPADGVPNAFPTRLSAIPALLAAGSGIDQTALGVVPYRPSATLWSDNARKERFIALPGVTQITFRAQDGWDFPENGLVVKNFILPVDERAATYQEKRLETRLLLREGDDWGGYSYRWNEDETDAILLPRRLNRPVPVTRGDGSVLNFEWFYPSRTDCFRCHTDPANRLLGINTGQMNFEITYPASGVRDNQLRALEHAGYFDAPLPAEPAELERIPAQEDTTASLASRARAYLHANCGFCHRPGGGGQVGTDFRWSVRLEDMGILNERPSGFDLDIPDAYLLLPGHPERSVLPARMESLDPAYMMPPLGRSRVDEQGLALIEEWIRSIPGAHSWIMY